MRYIEDQKSLEDFITRAASSSVLAIDTEFMREKTYYPQLCLIQMATDSEIVLIDPFCVDDLTSLQPLFENEDIVKLFHAATQDLEILLSEVGCLPKPIFDTQIAAALLGQSHQVGLGALIGVFCGTSIKKSDSFTDWSRRPLAESQMKYAAEDVAFLPELYAIMRGLLIEKERLAWLDEDFAALSDPDRFTMDPSIRYKKLKRVNQLTRKQLAAARELAAWREIQARKRNVPRKWILSDEQIVEACKREASTVSELFMVRGMKGQLSTKEAREIAGLIDRAFSMDEDSWPETEQGGQPEPNVDSAVDLMYALARVRAKENGIALQTLASHNDLVALARGHWDDTSLMTGWRRALIGEELIDLLEGRETLSLKDNTLVVSDRSMPDA